MKTVTIVEPSTEARRRFSRILEGDDYAVLDASDGLEALRITFEHRPDAAIVNLKAAGVDGVELIRLLRGACDIPILAIAEDDASSQIVRALDAGADDVMEPGCAAPELLARLRACIRRRAQTHGHPEITRQIRIGALEIDRDAQTVKKSGRPIALSRTEWRLLDALAARVGETAPHRYLLSTVWGDECIDDVQYLRVYVGYLRNKLEDDPSSPQYLVNEWGVGYRLARLPVMVETGPERELVGASR